LSLAWFYRRNPGRGKPRLRQLGRCCCHWRLPGDLIKPGREELLFRGLPCKQTNSPRALPTRLCAMPAFPSLLWSGLRTFRPRRVWQHSAPDCWRRQYDSLGFLARRPDRQDRSIAGGMGVSLFANIASRCWLLRCPHPSRAVALPDRRSGFDDYPMALPMIAKQGHGPFHGADLGKQFARAFMHR